MKHAPIPDWKLRNAGWRRRHGLPRLSRAPEDIAMPTWLPYAFWIAGSLMFLAGSITALIVRK